MFPKLAFVKLAVLYPHAICNSKEKVNEET